MMALFRGRRGRSANERRERRTDDDGDGPERPPITLVRVSLLEEDLGRDLSWREEGKRAGRTASDQLSDASRKKRKKKTNVIWSSDGTVSLESVKKRNYQPEPRDEKAKADSFRLPTSLQNSPASSCSPSKSRSCPSSSSSDGSS